MPLPFLIPAGLLAAVIAYLKYRGIHASVSAIKAAIKANTNGDDPYEAAIRAGASSLAANAIVDAIRFNF